MKNKTITQILFAAVLFIFILYFIFLHTYFLERNKYQTTLDQISVNAQADNWKMSEASLQYFMKSWDSVQYYVQFNHEDQSFLDMSADVVNLASAVHNKQKYETDLYVNRVKTLLEEFEKIVPQT